MTRDWDSKPPMSWGDVADLLAEVKRLRQAIQDALEVIGERSGQELEVIEGILRAALIDPNHTDGHDA